MAKLRIYYQNARSIRGKLNDLYLSSLKVDYDIIVITETWLNDSVLDAEVLNDNYRIYRRDRESTSGSKLDGGGVLIAISNKINSSRLSDLESNHEDIWIKVTDTSEANYVLIICAVYVPPPVTCDRLNSHLDCISNSMSSLNERGTFLVIGDFNIGSVNWSPDNKNNMSSIALLDSRSTVLDTAISDFLSLHDLNQFNLCKNKDDKILDLVLCSSSHVKTELVNPLSKIDPYHPPLLVSIDFPNFQYLKTLITKQPNFFAADYVKINNELNDIDWDAVFKPLCGVNDMVETFYRKTENVINKLVPLKANRKGQYPVWYTKDLIKLIKRKEKLHRKVKKFRNPLDEFEFKLSRARCHQLIDESYAIYMKTIEESISKNNMKSFWSFIKSKRQDKGSIPGEMELKGVKLATPSTICDAFAEHFSSVYASSGPIVPPHPQPVLSVCHGTLSRIQFTPPMVEKAFKNLDKNKGAGPDRIPAIFIANCASSLAYPLCFIYNFSLEHGVFPSVWRKANVIPIPKAGKANDIENYRPISLLSILGKVFESLVNPVLISHLKPFLVSQQHGFRGNKSTVSNLVLLVSEIAEAMDKGHQVDAVYTDIGKAFDRVDHTILLRKLSHFGIHGKLLNWFSSYLSSRSQKVVVCGHESKSFDAPSGVPQGSHLGPTLFLAFINDMSNVIRYSNFSLFADDLKIYKVINTVSDSLQLQEDLTRVLEWSQENKLPLNISKCKHIKFSRKRCPLATSYFINDITLEEVSVIKDLGVILDSKLSFNAHIDHIVSRAFKLLGFVWRNCKSFKGKDALITTYSSLVRSILEYCSNVWNPQYKCHHDRIERVQKRFLFYLSIHQKKLFSLETYEERLNFFNLPSLENRRWISDQVLLYKILNGLLLDSPQLLSKVGFTVPRQNSRIVNFRPFAIKNSRTNLGSHSVIPRICKQHNQIYKITRIDLLCISLNKFKCFLHKCDFNCINKQ